MNIIPKSEHKNQERFSWCLEMHTILDHDKALIV